VTVAEERELEALRELVYGPGGSTAPEEAVRRLGQLEEARRPTVPRLSEAPERRPEPVAVEVPQPEPPRRVETAIRWVLAQLEKVPRSVVLAVLAVAMVVTVVAVGLTVVHRLQPSPLQGQVEEVDRLSLDPTYRPPDMFMTGADGDVNYRAFEEFYGVRSIVGIGRVMYGNGSDDECMNVFVGETVEESETESFSGIVMGGCGAGGFEAMTQFVPDVDGWPEELRDAFPDSGLRFVYDSFNDEIVVYSTPL
jgi:hypothetical protein